jgi:hypothetical protein
MCIRSACSSPSAAVPTGLPVNHTWVLTLGRLFPQNAATSAAVETRRCVVTPTGWIRAKEATTLTNVLRSPLVLWGINGAKKNTPHRIDVFLKRGLAVAFRQLIYRHNAGSFAIKGPVPIAQNAPRGRILKRYHYQNPAANLAPQLHVGVHSGASLLPERTGENPHSAPLTVSARMCASKSDRRGDPLHDLRAKCKTCSHLDIRRNNLSIRRVDSMKSGLSVVR